ncbi:MAG TPA: CCA tRNA nucleotidyltransferase [Bacilli bacterium]
MSDAVTLQLNMEKEASEIIKVLTGHGFQAYFAGGYVRDLLFNKPVKDIDIATSALPEEVMGLFAHTAPTGLQHGTVTVMMKVHAFEVTTFRTESDYVQKRRPGKVEFVSSLEEDLKRRDFTINAMALGLDGQLIDPFHGKQDLQDLILRCVGNPIDRFNEDALRMMRCLRIASEYGLEVEEETWKALMITGPALKHIAMERIRVELEKMVEGSFPHKAIELLAASKLIKYFKVDAGLTLENFEYTLQYNLIDLPRIDNKEARWVYLFILMGMQAGKARETLHKLTFAKRKIDYIHKLLVSHEWIRVHMEHSSEWNWRDWVQSTIQFGKAAVTSWLTIVPFLNAANLNSTNDNLVWLRDFNEEKLHETVDIIQGVTVETVSDLKISGEDLLKIHPFPGVWIKEILDRLLIDVAFKLLPNRKEQLLAKALFYYQTEKSSTHE